MYTKFAKCHRSTVGSAEISISVFCVVREVELKKKISFSLSDLFLQNPLKGDTKPKIPHVKLLL